MEVHVKGTVGALKQWTGGGASECSGSVLRAKARYAKKSTPLVSPLPSSLICLRLHAGWRNTVMVLRVSLHRSVLVITHLVRKVAHTDFFLYGDTRVVGRGCREGGKREWVSHRSGDKSTGGMIVVSQRYCCGPCATCFVSPLLVSNQVRS